MVQHLQFSRSLDSKQLSQIINLSTRHICCAFCSLGIPVTLACCVLGVPWPLSLQLHMIWVFGCRLHSIFSGRSQTRLLGVSLVFSGALLEHITGSHLCIFSTIFFFVSIIFSGRAPWPREPLGPGLIYWKTDFPDQGTCRTWQAWYFCCRDFFWSLERMIISEVLVDSCPSSLWLAYVAGLIVD